MRTTTTILGATGLALIGAALLAAPANAATGADTAAPTASVAAEQGDRLAGKLTMGGYTFGVHSYPGYDPLIYSERGDEWEFPAVGTTGPVRSVTEGKCMQSDSPNSNIMVPGECVDGKPTQQFALDSEGRITFGESRAAYVTAQTGGASYLSGGPLGDADAIDLSVLRPVAGDGPVEVPAVDTIDNTSGSTVLGGTGVPGATIEIRDEVGAVIGTGSVQPDGSWSIDLGKDMSQTPENLDVVQKIGDKESAPVRIDAANLPIIAPAIAAGAGILALAGVGGAIVRGRRNV